MGPRTRGHFGDHGIRATAHQGGNGAFVIRRIKRAVRTRCEFGDFAHHALLVLFSLCTRSVIIQDDFSGFIGIIFRILPASHRGRNEAYHLIGKGRICEIVFQHIHAVFQSRHALIFVFEHHQIVGRQTCIDDLPVFIIGHG